VDFLSVDGKPLLTDINSGRFNGAHPSKLFHQAHAAPGSEFYYWKLSHDELAVLAKSGMSNITTLWQMIVEEGIAFLPGAAHKSGVFPMVALDGMRFQFLAIGNAAAVTSLVMRTKALIARCGASRAVSAEGSESGSACGSEVFEVLETLEAPAVAKIVETAVKRTCTPLEVQIRAITLPLQD
jgi:hypothetical protein